MKIKNKIQLKENEDGSYNISVANSDSCVTTIILTGNELQQLYIDIETLLSEDMVSFRDELESE